MRASKVAPYKRNCPQADVYPRLSQHDHEGSDHRFTGYIVNLCRLSKLNRRNDLSRIQRLHSNTSCATVIQVRAQVTEITTRNYRTSSYHICSLVHWRVDYGWAFWTFLSILLRLRKSKNEMPDCAVISKTQLSKVKSKSSSTFSGKANLSPPLLALVNETSCCLVQRRRATSRYRNRFWLSGPYCWCQIICSCPQYLV